MTDIRDFTTPANSLIKDCNGAANTAAITSTPGYESNYPAFFYVANLGDGWYVPSAGQLNYMIAYTPVLNESLELISGSSKNLVQFIYWTSDEYESSGNNQAWTLGEFLNFTQSVKRIVSGNKNRVRAFRNFSLSTKGEHAGTYNIGDVVTFVDGTKGVVFSLNREHTAGTVVAMNDYNSDDDADRWLENNDWWIWSSSERSDTQACFLLNTGVLSYDNKYAHASSITPSCVF